MSVTFKQITELDPSTLLIVDAFNLAFRWGHKNDLDFVDSYLKTVESFRTSFKAGKVIIATDNGSSSYRKAIYPEYKANRKEKIEKQTEQEREFFELFFKEFKRVLAKYRELGTHPVIEFEKTEADDIAAVIVKYAKAYGIKRIYLLSSDRDWDLLVATTDEDLEVNRFSYATSKEINIETWNDHYACKPEEYISLKCLQGDSGDNVPGVDKIGPKTAKKLIDQYGSALDIADALPLPGKYVYIANLNKFGADRLMLNYQLMDLPAYCEDAVGVENCEKIKEILSDYL